MEIKDDVIIFESDEEFTDFCVAPFATVEGNEQGKPHIKGHFSEQYKKSLEEGKAFVIKGRDSAVCRNKSVSKRVPVIMEGVSNRMALIQLNDVQNVMDYHTWEFFGTDLQSNETNKKEFMDRKQCLKQLHDSFTFQMSLGSKELFHSNFLQWLSVIDWNGFMQVLHKLAETESFWWENEKCPVDVDDVEIKVEAEGNPHNYHPDHENIEVRREHNNYDLSIYILTGYTKPHGNNERQKKWCPVFILENKVKSMPYQHQLDGYVKKSFEEWKKMIEPSKTKKDYAKLWEDKPISYVLLTLFDEINISSSPINNNTINWNKTVNWNKYNYSYLSKILSDNLLYKNEEELTDKVIKDYCGFIEALYKLSISPDWNVCIKSPYATNILQGGAEEKKLRIDDLRQKVLHERMLILLENKLKDAFPSNCEHWSKEKEYKDKERKELNLDRVFYNTSFSRGSGITEAFVIINENYRLMIQLQNNQYRKCLILRKKQNENDSDLETRLNNTRKKLTDIWEDYNEGTQNSFGRDFKYKYDPINTTETIDEILDKVVNDIQSIFNKMDDLKKIH